MDTISRRLLFRIGAIGFCVRLDELIEIREEVTDLIAVELADQDHFIAGSLVFRNAHIPALDLAGRLGLERQSTDTALVLGSSEGNWALLVDRVEGFFPETELLERPLPRFLQTEGWTCFHQVALHHGHPYLCLDLAACYAGGPG